jgi:hypothetical protein
MPRDDFTNGTANSLHKPSDNYRGYQTFSDPLLLTGPEPECLAYHQRSRTSEWDRKQNPVHFSRPQERYASSPQAVVVAGQAQKKKIQDGTLNHNRVLTIVGNGPQFLTLLARWQPYHGNFA